MGLKQARALFFQPLFSYFFLTQGQIFILILPSSYDFKEKKNQDLSHFFFTKSMMRWKPARFWHHHRHPQQHPFLSFCHLNQDPIRLLPRLCGEDTPERSPSNHTQCIWGLESRGKIHTGCGEKINLWNLIAVFFKTFSLLFMNLFVGVWILDLDNLHNF